MPGNELPICIVNKKKPGLEGSQAGQNREKRRVKRVRISIKLNP